MILFLRQLSLKHLRPAFFSGLVEILWGCVLMNPYSNLFDRYPYIYAPMKSLVNSEIFWGGLYLAAGITAICLIRTETIKGRMFAALLLAFFGFSKVSLFFIGDGLNQGVTTYGIIAVYNLIDYFRFKRELSQAGANV